VLIPTLFLIVQVATPADSLVKRLPPVPYCLPQNEAALGRVRLGDVRDTVLARLGPPISHQRRTSEDDGGVYPVDALAYRRLRVDIGRGDYVEHLETTSPAISTPSGIRVGQTLAEVTRRLGVPDTLPELRKATWAPLLCDDGPLDAVAASPTVTFHWRPVPGPFDPKRPANTGRRLTRIEMDDYGP
jgi:hypothetical protein